MKATKEYRAWLKRMVQWKGKKNGVVPGALLDNPWMERKLQSGKRSKSDLPQVQA